MRWKRHLGVALVCGFVGLICSFVLDGAIWGWNASAEGREIGMSAEEVMALQAEMDGGSCYHTEAGCCSAVPISIGLGLLVSLMSRQAARGVRRPDN